jgi:uncharacterized protein
MPSEITDQSSSGDVAATLLAAAKDKEFRRVAKILQVMNSSHLSDKRVGEAFIRTAIGEDVAALRQFVAKGIDVNVVVNQSTALGASSLRASVVAVRFLLRLGAHVDQRSKEDDTPLIAVCRGAFLVLHLRSFGDHEKVAGILLKGGADPNAHNSAKMCPLHYAAHAGAARLCTMLVQAGADVASRDMGGGTPLEYAAISGDVDSTKLLIKRGADVNTKNFSDATPLHIAAALNRPGVARLLLAAGADLRARNRDGATAADVARRLDRMELVSLLEGG